jgi:hypothetical protein
MTNDAVYAFCKTLTLAQATEWREADNRAGLMAQLLEAANIGTSSHDMSQLEAQFEHLLSRDTERQILEKLVDDCLFYGCFVSVHSGEDWEIQRSQDRAKILAACQATDADALILYDADGLRVGTVCLIYGNGYDVISDCTDNEGTRALLAGAEALAESLCEAAHR